METNTLHQRLLLTTPTSGSLLASVDGFYSGNLLQLKRILVGDTLAADLKRNATYASTFNLGLCLLTAHPLVATLATGEQRVVSQARAILQDHQSKLLQNQNSIYAKLYARLDTSI